MLVGLSTSSLMMIRQVTLTISTKHTTTLRGSFLFTKTCVMLEQDFLYLMISDMVRRSPCVVFIRSNIDRLSWPSLGSLFSLILALILVFCFWNGIKFMFVMVNFPFYPIMLCIYCNVL